MSNRYFSKTSVTRPNDTTAYAALDVLGTSPASVIEFANIAPVGGGSVILVYASLMINVGTSSIGQTRLHLFNAAPTAIADNAAFNLPSGDRDKYLGYLTLGTPLDLGDTMFVEDDFIRKPVIASGSSLFAIAQTISGFTPTAQAVKTWELRSVLP